MIFISQKGSFEINQKNSVQKTDGGILMCFKVN